MSGPTVETLLTRTPWLIAEIGCNHCGDPALAHRLTQICIDAGVDAVKGQLRDVYGSPDLYGKGRPYEGPASYGRTYLAHRQALELPLEVHRELRDRCMSQGVSYSVSVWDVPSALTWVKEAPDWVKVPSARMSDLNLLRTLRDQCVVFMSTGMHTEAEIEESESLVPDRLVLLHTTSAYPCAPKDVNLAAMVEMARYYCDTPVGISGHWTGASAIDVAATALGARVIERHVTLDRASKGTDHAASLEPAGIHRWVRDVRQYAIAYGEAGIRRDGVPACEEKARAKLMGGAL
jgi:sialic acid synthase SpsE